jgi:hypothetical protein
MVVDSKYFMCWWMSDSEYESATEYTSLMDAHVAPVRTESVADKIGRKRKQRNSQEPRADTAESEVNIACHD